jgi:hypothetical protein
MPKASWLVQRQLPVGGVVPTDGAQVVREKAFAVIRKACFVGKSAESTDFGCHRPEALAS